MDSVKEHQFNIFYQFFNVLVQCKSQIQCTMWSQETNNFSDKVVINTFRTALENLIFLDNIYRKCFTVLVKRHTL